MGFSIDELHVDSESQGASQDNTLEPEKEKGLTQERAGEKAQSPPRENPGEKAEEVEYGEVEDKWEGEENEDYVEGNEVADHVEEEEYEGGGKLEEKGKEDDRDILLSINVELEDDCPSELLILREGDSPYEVATRFCEEHNLPSHFIGTLTHHIQENIEHYSENQDEVSNAWENDPSVGEANETSSAWENHPSVGDSWSEYEDDDDDDDDNERYSRSRTPENNFTSLKERGESYEDVLSSTKPLYEDADQQLHKERRSMLEKLSNQTSENASKSNLEQMSKKVNGNYGSGVSSKKNDPHMRLYVEFMRHEQRLEEEKRQLFEQYKEKLEREKPVYSKKSKKIMQMRGKAAQQFRNYGELLYQEALKKERERREIIEQKRLEEKANELKAVTTKPEISKLARKIKQDGHVWDRLCREKPKKDIQELRNEALTSTLMECTFRPRINHRSERCLHQTHDAGSETANRFDQLFWDAENRRRRQAQYSEWYPEGVTFRPAVNRARRSTAYFSEEQNNDNNVFNRLLQYSSKLTAKRQMLQEEVSKPIDPTTGQKLFRPQTGRRPNSQRNSSSLPIGEFLYQMKFVMDNKKQSLAEKEQKKKKELANHQYVSDKSNQLLERLKERSLQQIFDDLDVNKEGHVDLNAVDIDQLDNDVAEDIEEIKKQGILVNTRISFDEFVSLMHDVQKRKNKPTHLWLKTYKKNQGGEKPLGSKLEQSTKDQESGKGRFGSTQQWYQIILSDKERKLAKLEALRKEKENRELAECTFKPSIHIKNARGTPRGTPKTPSNNRVAPQSTVVEKETQEVHAFLF